MCAWIFCGVCCQLTLRCVMNGSGAIGMSLLIRVCVLFGFALLWIVCSGVFLVCMCWVFCMNLILIYFEFFLTLVCSLVIAAVRGLGAVGVVVAIGVGFLLVFVVFVVFLSVLVVWGWVELVFLSGIIIGLVACFCLFEVPEWECFICVWGIIVYHEMLFVVLVIVMGLMVWGVENLFGFYIFVLLFVVWILAKFNLFYGVRKINVEFLPKFLLYLPSYFRIVWLNWVFLIFVIGLIVVMWFWLEWLVIVSTGVEVVGYVLLVALMVFVVLEYWLMVLLLFDEKFWCWMLSAFKV